MYTAELKNNDDYLLRYTLSLCLRNSLTLQSCGESTYLEVCPCFFSQYTLQLHPIRTKFLVSLFPRNSRKKVADHFSVLLSFNWNCTPTFLKKTEKILLLNIVQAVLFFNRLVVFNSFTYCFSIGRDQKRRRITAIDSPVVWSVANIIIYCQGEW